MSHDDHYCTEESELIKGCLRGDRKAQRVLYEKYSPRMFGVCIRYVGDRDSASDVLQDGFVTVFSKLGSYSGAGSFEGWMRRIFVNQSLMKLRRNDLLKDAEDIMEMKSGTPFVDDALDHLHSEDIFRLVSSMPAGFRTVFNLSVIEGFSHQEIAAQLNISEGTSRSQLSRAREWLKERITLMEKKRNDR